MELIRHHVEEKVFGLSSEIGFFSKSLWNNSLTVAVAGKWVFFSHHTEKKIIFDNFKQSDLGCLKWGGGSLCFVIITNMTPIITSSLNLQISETLDIRDTVTHWVVDSPQALSSCTLAVI